MLPAARSVAPPFDAAAVAALPPMRQGSIQPYAPIEGPDVWLASDFPDASAYTIELSEAQGAELGAAAARILESGRAAAVGNRLEGVCELTVADFDLPTLGPLLREAGREVATGRGFVLLRRLPVAAWSRAQALVAFWGMGLHWGVPMAQNERGHVIGHVTDVGVDPENRNPNTRIYMTRAAQPWHVDSADAAALLCLAEAKEGGETAFASSSAIINIIRQEEPELLPVLAGPWFFDRKGELVPGESPVFDMPILHYHRGRALVAFHDSYYQLASNKWGGAATLTPLQERALQKFREVADRPGVAVRYRMSPGDVPVIHNHTAVHNRSAYRDWEDESGSKRHLLRLWIAYPPPGAPPLPPCYAHLFKRFAGDDRGLTRRAGSDWAPPGGGVVPLEAEVGQAHIPGPGGAEGAAAGGGARQ
ncbi:MAG: hypothetical protein J3K34DRAFT_429454 [Monoraphidium minutum]|nr:MAG: hypothetical protein J3K34DRAFT_429454 [Monoraphidium minutum]